MHQTLPCRCLLRCSSISWQETQRITLRYARRRVSGIGVSQSSQNEALIAGARAAVTARISQGTISLLRGRLKIGLHARNLKMTETAAKHMLEPSRYVPLQIQERAIRFGKRMPDPREGKGMFRYETDIYKLRYDKQRREYVHQKYKFEVIVRESDWTISHFKCFY
jgi:hypothetical protein